MAQPSLRMGGRKTPLTASVVIVGGTASAIVNPQITSAVTVEFALTDFSSTCGGTSAEKQSTVVCVVYHHYCCSASVLSFIVLHTYVW